MRAMATKRAVWERSVRQTLRRDREPTLEPNPTMPQNGVGGSRGSAMDGTGRGHRAVVGRRSGAGLPLPRGATTVWLRPLGPKALIGGDVRTPTGRRSLPCASWRRGRLGWSSLVVGLRFVG